MQRELALFSFSSLPHHYVDPLTGEWRSPYQEGELSEDDQKTLDKFQKFVKKLDTLASVKIGNGTEDEFVVEQVTKFRTELKPERVTATTLEKGDYFQLVSRFTNGGNRGNVYQVVDRTEKMIFGVKMGKGYKKVLAGMSSSGNYFNVSIEQMEKWMEGGAIQKVQLVEVNTPYTVEKCVRKRTKPAKKCEVPIQYEVEESKDTRDNSPIWVVKAKQNLSKVEFKNVAEQMRKGGGYYSRFCHGFLFRQNPAEFLQGC